MIRLGVCTAAENIELVAKAGFDYIELSFAWLAGLTDEAFEMLREDVSRASIGVEACNGMLPGELKVTGPDVDEAAVRAYLDKTFRRGSELGVKTVVFGSGAARGVPEGFAHEEAWRQIARYLTIVSEYCAKYGMETAIEPLRRAECNILNYVSEGAMMSALLNKPGIGVLGDTHHMRCGGEPYAAFAQAGRLLKHVHISHSMGDEGGRDFPAPGDGGDYKEVFDALKACGYDGRVSIEAGCKNPETDMPRAYQALREALEA